MKKSLIAAAFAATLPAAAIAQDNEAPSTEPQEFCQPISPTAEFCAAVGTQGFPIQAPNGQLLFAIPGRVQDGEQTFDQCLFIADPTRGPVGIQCAQTENNESALTL